MVLPPLLSCQIIMSTCQRKKPSHLVAKYLVFIYRGGHRRCGVVVECSPRMREIGVVVDQFYVKHHYLLKCTFNQTVKNYLEIEIPEKYIIFEKSF